ncbi:MAG: ABC transporter ATP-binding protein [Alphaproteobacteria bacterium]
MASIELNNIRKTFAPDVIALDDINLTIETGEFFTLLGPSGCGKTTLLRTIAGFNLQDSGTVVLGGERIDHVPAYRRDAGMVFQDYAIFPHMSVADNVAFGLRNRGVARAEIRDRVEEALKMARLDGFGERMPNQLSGGQQQRVGLARAMVIRPQVLLMDEPLSNLDAKLRIELREDIRALQRQLGITTIYVTHDQEEALVISDRICVMVDGVVHQVGTPWEIYREPKSRFVAGFVGGMNFVPGHLTVGGDGAAANLHLGSQAVAWPRSGQSEGEAASDSEVAMAIRPEDVLVGDDPPPVDGFKLEGRVARISFTGRDVQYGVECADGTRIDALVTNPSAEFMGRIDQNVRLLLPEDRLALFDPDTGERV